MLVHVFILFHALILMPVGKILIHRLFGLKFNSRTRNRLIVRFASNIIEVKEYDLNIIFFILLCCFKVVWSLPENVKGRKGSPVLVFVLFLLLLFFCLVA